MKCPVCKDVSLVMTDRQGVEIDYCPECRGVWLDRGELDKIIERTNPDVPNEVPRHKDRGSKHYSDDSPMHGTHKKKKKGGLLKELFDF
ncbi:MAG: zf-TFIIB domain-containing protein [Desulfobacterales bacterium]|nr:zf-TFIIB domain-containing protein [Desulfobacterales bacterium]